MTEPSRVFVAPDSRTAEEHLLAEIQRLLPPGIPAPESPGVRVLVPSNSLREHLLARIAGRRPAWLGLEVTTLAAAARSTLLEAGETPPRGGLLFGLLVERTARRRPALAAAFGEFADGWVPFVGAARDLVDAGFEPALAEALAERLEDERGSLPRRILDRARALIEVTAEVLAQMASSGLAPEGARFARAAAAMADRAGTLRSDHLFLYGFADATGVASDLLAAAVRHAGARAILISPPDLETGPSGFGGRLRERLESVGGRAAAIPPQASPGVPEELVASAPDGEAARLAAAIGAALDGGESPERIGLVLRDPAAHRSRLRRSLERRGIPYSAGAAHGPTSPLAHRARALLRCLDQRGETPADSALELLDEAPELSAEHRAGARLALRALGIARLGDLGPLDAEAFERFRATGFRLPVRVGLVSDEDDRETAPHRRLPVEPLVAALARLQGLLARLESWPARSSWPGYRTALSELLASVCLETGEAGQKLLARADPVADELPEGFDLTATEASSLLARAWEPLEREPWGGSGAGVQVLSVTEARGRTFGCLFVAGLVRGEFPRVVAEDPVLPDALRLRLRELLPDLPVKREGHDEERFLFEQLLGSAPRIVLSRALQDEEGRPTPASPLLEAIGRRGTLATLQVEPGKDRALLDRAIEAALEGRERGLAPHLAPALEEGRRRFSPGARFDPTRTAAGRQRVLLEYDTDPTRDEGRRRIRRLGPYFGFVGGRADDEPVAATTLEAQADCAWRAFLERRLRLERPPDPLEALPELDPRLLGSVVHAALAALFEDPQELGDATVAARVDLPGRPLVWPEETQVERVARRVAAEALRASGLGGRGLEPLLTARALARLRIARAEDESSGAIAVLGVELDGGLRIERPDGRRTEVRFRADRAQREGDWTVLVDFKVGRVPTGLDTRREATRQKHLLLSVLRGRRLQAALYAASLDPRAAEGRYVFLAPNDDAPVRALGLENGEPLRDAVDATASLLLEARDRGLHPPRLLDGKLEKEYDRCEHCEVLEACIQRDSGFRLRLERWHELEAGRDDLRSAREEALWQLWRLPTSTEEEP